MAKSAELDQVIALVKSERSMSPRAQPKAGAAPSRA